MSVAAVSAWNALDTNELLARCLGKRELVERVLTRFQTQLTEDLVRLQAAAETGDGEMIAKTAHRIKGAAANVSAHGLRQCAAALEEAARAGAWDQVPTRLELLSAERDEFDGACQQFAWRAGPNT